MFACGHLDRNHNLDLAIGDDVDNGKRVVCNQRVTAVWEATTLQPIQGVQRYEQTQMGFELMLDRTTSMHRVIRPR